jgi:hypothetical protein
MTTNAPNTATYVQTFTMTANTVYLITFPNYYPSLQILNSGAGDFWITATPGATVAADGNECILVPAGTSGVITNREPRGDVVEGLLGTSVTATSVAGTTVTIGVF